VINVLCNLRVTRAVGCFQENSLPKDMEKQKQKRNSEEEEEEKERKNTHTTTHKNT
jgi:hypothetical protein